MKYQEIEANIIQKYFNYIVSFDPILNQVRTVKTIHAGGMRYQIEEKESVIPLNTLSFEINISHAEISEYDLSAFAESIYMFTKERIDETHRMLYQTLDKVTAMTGNVVNAEGKPLNADMILDMIEKVEMTFDENGEPIKKTFVAGTDLFKKLSNIKFTPAQEERHKQIIERKKKEYNAKKRHRRLSYV
jgi:hypothetical protein